MSKASQIIVLCEDEAHKVFVRRFLKKGWGVNHRIIRVLNFPNGAGSGKKFVIDNVSKEVEALRKRSASTILVVVRDVDEDSIAQAKASLDEQLLSPRQTNEPIIYVTPKWHIQTWIAYLDGESVNENDSQGYKRRYREKSETKKGHHLVDKLAEKCKHNLPLEAAPLSLIDSCKEFKRIRNFLK